MFFQKNQSLICLILLLCATETRAQEDKPFSALGEGGWIQTWMVAGPVEQSISGFGDLKEVFPFDENFGSLKMSCQIFSKG